MSDELSGAEILILWDLALANGGKWKRDVKPGLDKSRAARLGGGGFIEQDRRSPEGTRRTLAYISLTDRGWHWLGEHLDHPINTKSPASASVLERLLTRLRDRMQAAGTTLAEFLRTQSPEGEASRDGLDRRIEQAYFSLSGGRPNVRVRLADLRQALPGTPAHEIDSTLIEFAASGRAALYRLDNPQEIHDRDRAATLRTPSGEERHIVYMGGSGS